MHKTPCGFLFFNVIWESYQILRTIIGMRMSNIEQGTRNDECRNLDCWIFVIPCSLFDIATAQADRQQRIIHVD
jgi:hypothetical protein